MVLLSIFGTVYSTLSNIWTNEDTSNNIYSHIEYESSDIMTASRQLSQVNNITQHNQ